MTPAQNEIIAQLEQRLVYLQGRIAFHGNTRQALIAEAASVQRDIDAVKGMGEEELVLCWQVNEANEGQD